MIFEDKRETFKYKFDNEYYVCYNENLKYCEFLDKIVIIESKPVIIPYNEEFLAKFFVDRNGFINLDFLKKEEIV